ncbi:ABC transporter ATP-binding protein [Clostridium uliginosum]|uniref:ATP-binding cassette, subfamily B n=1 Tax=Clostridium uliginosum TaxID=119641 RepID=A0A1I1NK31_9CLOT|nr:ABC transporter ATP-binding protein [Clostridium uliginosum]SFC98011.1 ATP-binding cassette, subfamily B [Clostridium uliginosum]
MNNTLIRIFKYIGERKGLLFISIIFTIISVTTNLIGPILIGKSIDNMIGKGNVNFKEVFNIIFILAVVYICSNLFNWLLSYFLNLITYKTVNSMREQLFNKINLLSLKFYDGNAHGDIISRFINDIDTVGDGLLQGMSSLFIGVATIIGSIAFMLSINFVMTLVVILSAPITFFVARFVTKKSKKMFSKQAKTLGELNGYAEEIIRGQKVVKAFNYEKHSYDRFKAINEQLYNSGVKSQFYGSLANPSTRLVNNITYSIIGIIGSIVAIMGKITVGGISSFLIYSTLFSKPFNEITGVLTQIQAAIASANRVFSIIDMEEEQDYIENLVNIEECRGHVTFNNVSFAYDKKNPLITNLNLDIKPGSRVAIVGKTGAGKTTLVNLLMRFYEVNEGQISIDGINIQHMNRDDLRQRFGMVLQDTFLFSDTIGNNIAYGKPEASKDEIIKAAKGAEVHSFIRRLPKEYDTEITSSGDNLSQGQKQLLTIARVMLADPPMLILDEATSNIDTRTELHIQKAFERIMEGRTTFIIAHRLSTIKEADIILVMDNGNIVESGTHEGLLKKKGHYARIYNSQFQVN